MTFIDKNVRSVRYLGAAILGCTLFSMSLHAQATSATTSPSTQAAAPAGPPSGCVLHGKAYSCNIGLFRHILRQAKTVEVEGGPQDIAADKQLHELADRLHKNVIAKGQNADLHFVLLPIDNHGILIGPADSDLAALRVYASSPDGSQGQLLWSEIYRGQADRPWSLTVHALIQQFEDRLQPHKS